MARRFVVAVDGPAGAGKGTLCKALATRFQLAYLDTGALYRAIALLSLDREEENPRVLAELAREMDFSFRPEGDGEFMAWLDGVPVGAALRREEVGRRASLLAAEPPVREALLSFQRQFGGDRDIVLDGRDVGTVVWPGAALKIFLVASVEARAQRRALELRERGEVVNLSAIRQGIEERDARDSQRSHAPLRPAGDAVLLDSTALSIPEMIARAGEILAERRAGF